MKEEWKRLIYNGEDYGDFYFVSNYGEIKNAKTNYVRKKYYEPNRGYYQLYISLGHKNKTKLIKIHRAVACTFIDNSNNLPYVNHIDGNKTNNIITNLEWVTNSENQIHAKNIGLSKSGERHRDSKLTDMQVNDIIENCIPRDKYYGCKAFGDKYGISPSLVSEIIHNRRHKNYDDNYKLIDRTIVYKNNLYDHVCKYCNNKFISKKINSVYCSLECRKQYNANNSNIPSMIELKNKLIEVNNFVELGRIYNVSDNAVRKWCVKYGLPSKKEDLKNFIKINA